MSAPLMFVVVVALFILYALYATQKLRNKILCTFRRVNKTKVEKFVTMQDRYVVFDGGKYDIVPSSITFQWYNRGIHQFAPTWVATLDFTHESRWPLNPNTFNPSIDSPRVRKNLNKEEDFNAFGRGVNAQVDKKKQGLQKWLPWIVGGVAIMLIYIYFNGQLTSMANYMNTQFANITNTLNSIK